MRLAAKAIAPPLSVARKNGGRRGRPTPIRTPRPTSWSPASPSSPSVSARKSRRRIDSITERNWPRDPAPRISLQDKTSDGELTDGVKAHGDTANQFDGYSGGATPGCGTGRGGVAALGAVSERAPMGYRPRGLQRARQRLGVPAARPGAQPRLSLGRRRARRLRRRPAPSLPRPRAVERAPPD